MSSGMAIPSVWKWLQRRCAPNAVDVRWLNSPAVVIRDWVTGTDVIVINHRTRRIRGRKPWRTTWVRWLWSRFWNQVWSARDFACFALSLRSERIRWWMSRMVGWEGASGAHLLPPTWSRIPPRCSVEWWIGQSPILAPWDVDLWLDGLRTGWCGVVGEERRETT